MSMPQSTDSSLGRSRIALSVLFFLFGINIGTWAAHIPVVQARIGIDTGLLGLALLGAGAGTIIGQPLAGMLVARLGSRPLMIATPPLAAIVMAIMVATQNIPALFVINGVVGITWGAFAVAMNTQASEIESLRGRPSISGFHAAASLGMLVGTLLGSAVIAAGLGNGLGAAGIAAAAIVLSITVSPFLLHAAPAPRGPALVLPRGDVLVLGLLAMLMFIVEGGMVDWSALFLAREKGADPALAGSGFAIFTAAMVLMRVLGNRVVERFGPRLTVFIGGVLVALGIGLATLAPGAPLAAAALGLTGLGAANIIPVLISAAARTPGAPPSVSIGAVSSMMTFGFLVGPPLIGIISEMTSLSFGFSLMALSGLVVAVAGLARRWQATPAA